MNILLTGASGFLGNQILKELLKTEHKIRCLVHRKPLQIVSDKIEFVEGSLTHNEFLYDLTKNIDVVIHSAALISFKKFRKKEMFDVNVYATRNLVNASLENKVRKFIYISSIAAVGAHLGEGIINEQFAYNLKPLRVNYSITKYLAEFEVLRGQHEGMDSIILNPGNIIGPEDFKFANFSYVQMAQFNPQPVFQGGIGLVDVRDVADAVIKSINQEGHGQRYILISENVTYQNFLHKLNSSVKQTFSFPKTIAKMMAYLMEGFEFISKIKMPLSIEKGRLFNFYFWGDNSKSKTELGIIYRPVEETIHDMLAWYQSVGKLKHD